MQKVLIFHKEDKNPGNIIANAMDRELLLEHLTTRKTASFEWYPDFNLCSFDWYDINRPGTGTERILIYLSRKDLLIFCETSEAQSRMSGLLKGEAESSERQLHYFLVELLAGDMDYIDNYEDVLTDAEDRWISVQDRDYMMKIQEYRKELLKLKRYYTQLQIICDGLLDNANGLISREETMHFNILHSRVDRCYAAVLNLQDRLTQMREAYQAQIDIEQNKLMKFFALITALFLPLTLMVGWYGMNFRNMPELSSPWGYPVFIAASVLISAGLILYFKKKKWF